MFSAAFLGACHIFYKLSAEGATHGGKSVSYTHLTLPTKLEV